MSHSRRLTNLEYSLLQAIRNPLLREKGCLPMDIPPWSWTYWIPSVIFDTTLFLLSLWKTVAIVVESTASSPRLLVVLLRDSFLYFGGVMFWSIANLVAWYIQPVSPLNYFCRSNPFTGVLNSHEQFPFYGTFIGYAFFASKIPNIQRHAQWPYMLPVHLGLSNAGMYYKHIRPMHTHTLDIVEYPRDRNLFQSFLFWDTERAKFIVRGAEYQCYGMATFSKP